MTYDDIKNHEYHTLTPAYGKDYTSKDSVEDALRSGKDFVIHVAQGRTYCSVRDFRANDALNVHYNKRTELAAFTLKEDGKI